MDNSSPEDNSRRSSSIPNTPPQFALATISSLFQRTLPHQASCLCIVCCMTKEKEEEIYKKYLASIGTENAKSDSSSPVSGFGNWDSGTPSPLPESPILVYDAGDSSSDDITNTPFKIPIDGTPIAKEYNISTWKGFDDYIQDENPNQERLRRLLQDFGYNIPHFRGYRPSTSESSSRASSTTLSSPQESPLMATADPTPTTSLSASSSSSTVNIKYGVVIPQLRTNEIPEKHDDFSTAKEVLDSARKTQPGRHLPHSCSPRPHRNRKSGSAIVDNKTFYRVMAALNRAETHREKMITKELSSSSNTQSPITLMRRQATAQ